MKKCHKNLMAYSLIIIICKELLKNKFYTMANLTLRNNYSPMKSIFEDFFNDDFFGLSKMKANIPAVNLKETEKEFLIEVAAPGYKKDSFNIEIKDDYLTISSKNESTNETKEEKFHRKEFSYSSFERSFYLPENVDAENIKASYSEGVLNISIPKTIRVEKNKRMIEIQ
jgi:HSP20 family protein